MIRPSTAAPPYVQLLVSALAVAAGLQLLRSLLSGFSVYLGQVQDVPPGLLATLIAAIFLSAFAAPLARRMFGARAAFLSLAATLATLRLAEQFSSDLDVRLAVAVAGVVCWLWLMPLSCARHSRDEANGGPPAALALLLGLTIDTAIKGSFLTLDLSSAPGLAPPVTTIVLTAAQLALVFWLARTPAGSIAESEPREFGLAIGPAIAVHLLIFQNLGHHAALTGWSLPAVFAWTTAANVVAIAVLLFTPPRATRLPVRCWPLIVLGLLLVPLQAQPPWLSAIAALLGPAATAVGLQGALTSKLTRNRLDRFSQFGLPLGLFSIPLLLLGWYAPYEMKIPISQSALIWIAVLVIAVFGIASKADGQRASWPGRDATLGAVCLLFALPLFQVLTGSAPEPAPRTAQLRLMTYNIHQGFDLYGRHDLEGIAEVIEDSQAQIVALQEVPRGWVVNGSVDALLWLSQRLGMHAAWGPAADANWGNAILSRYPFATVSNRPMPNNGDLLFDRAYMVATIDLGDRPLQVVATHLHHIEHESRHRLPQVQALLREVDWNRPTILLGDLNAQPQHEEIRLLTSAGLSTIQPPVATYPADGPKSQIDYVLTTAHFEIIDVFAPESTASDHLALVATLRWSGLEEQTNRAALTPPDCKRECWSQQSSQLLDPLDGEG